MNNNRLTLDMQFPSLQSTEHQTNKVVESNSQLENKFSHVQVPNSSHQDVVMQDSTSISNQAQSIQNTRHSFKSHLEGALANERSGMARQITQSKSKFNQRLSQLRLEGEGKQKVKEEKQRQSLGKSKTSEIFSKVKDRLSFKIPQNYLQQTKKSNRNTFGSILQNNKDLVNEEGDFDLNFDITFTHERLSLDKSRGDSTSPFAARTSGQQKIQERIQPQQIYHKLQKGNEILSEQKQQELVKLITEINDKENVLPQCFELLALLKSIYAEKGMLQSEEISEIQSLLKQQAQEDTALEERITYFFSSPEQERLDPERQEQLALRAKLQKAYEQQLSLLASMVLSEVDAEAQFLELSLGNEVIKDQLEVFEVKEQELKEQFSKELSQMEVELQEAQQEVKLEKFLQPFEVEVLREEERKKDEKEYGKLMTVRLVNSPMLMEKVQKEMLDAAPREVRELAKKEGMVVPQIQIKLCYNQQNYIEKVKLGDSLFMEASLHRSLEQAIQQSKKCFLSEVSLYRLVDHTAHDFFSLFV